MLQQIHEAGRDPVLFMCLLGHHWHMGSLVILLIAFNGKVTATPQALCLPCNQKKEEMASATFLTVPFVNN